MATALRAERWLALLRRDKADPARSDCYALTLVGFMGNTVLPARMGDGLRVVLISPRAATRARTAIGTLLAERVLDVVTLFSLFALLALLVSPGTGGVPDAAWIAAGTAAALGVTALVVLGRAAERGTGPLGRIASFLAPMLAATRALRGRWALRMLGVTLAIWIVEAGVWLLSGTAVGVHLAPHEALYLLALSSIFALIPSGPGYAGTLDTAVLLGAASLGVSGGDAVSYLLMLRFVLFVPITLAGLAALLARYGGRRGLVAARARAGTA